MPTKIHAYQGERTRITKLHVLFLICCCVLLPLSGQTFASVQTIEASAPIINNDIASARSNAIKNGLWQILEYSDATILSKHLTNNGTLDTSLLSIAQFDHLQYFDILQERHENGRLHIVMSVQLSPLKQTCLPAQYAVGVIEPYILDPAGQAQNQLTELPHWLISQIQRNRDTQHQWVTLASQPTELNEWQYLFHERNMQYALQLTIDNLTAEYSFPTKYAFWQAPKARRHFALRAALIDTHSGMTIWQQGFRFVSDWEWQFNAPVNLYSERFINSQYHQLLQQIITELRDYLNGELSCRVAKASVTRTQGNQLTINLGQQHGISVGERFVEPQSQHEFVVQQVQPQHSQLSANIAISLLNIQPKTVLYRKQ